jgi:hypothetical protein
VLLLLLMVGVRLMFGSDWRHDLIDYELLLLTGVLTIIARFYHFHFELVAITITCRSYTARY